MKLSDLENKDVIDMKTGEKIGNVIDVEISDLGMISKLLLYEKKGIIKTIRGVENDSILWNQIKKIGSDVILVNKN